MIIKTIPAVPETEFSETFVQAMYDRMATSFAKYGLLEKAYPDKVNAIETLEFKLRRYASTGNTELLVDIANYAMIEFLRPRHAMAGFRPTDTGPDNQRVWNDGVLTQKANVQPVTAALRQSREGD